MSSSEKLLKCYNKFEFNPIKAVDNVYLCDESGEKYLDFVGGIGVNSLGYNNIIIEKAIISQIHKGFFAQSNYYHNDSTSLLAEKLCEISGLYSAFFCNSGAEACEAAIKFARKRFNTINKSQDCEIICLKNAFHGRTLATISAGGKKEHLNGFDPVMPGFIHAEINNIDSILSKISNKTAGIMIEIIQGEGGVVECDANFLQKLQDICDSKEIPFIIDEVQTGIGRTGKFFGFENFGLKPDIIMLAKGLGGGIPIGCCLASEEISSYISPGNHGSTFGGNALATSIALSVINEINNENFLENIKNLGKYFKTELEKLKHKYPKYINRISGRGLMIGFELSSEMNNKELANLFLKNKLLVTLASNNVIRFLPPLIIEKKHIDEAIEIIDLTIPQIAIMSN